MNHFSPTQIALQKWELPPPLPPTIQTCTATKPSPATKTPVCHLDNHQTLSLHQTLSRHQEEGITK